MKTPAPGSTKIDQLLDNSIIKSALVRCPLTFVICIVCYLDYYYVGYFTREIHLRVIVKISRIRGERPL